MNQENWINGKELKSKTIPMTAFTENPKAHSIYLLELARTSKVTRFERNIQSIYRIHNIQIM